MQKNSAARFLLTVVLFFLILNRLIICKCTIINTVFAGIDFLCFRQLKLKSSQTCPQFWISGLWSSMCFISHPSIVGPYCGPYREVVPLGHVSVQVYYHPCVLLHFRAKYCQPTSRAVLWWSRISAACQSASLIIHIFLYISGPSIVSPHRGPYRYEVVPLRLASVHV